MTPPTTPNIGNQLAALTERIEAQGQTLNRLETTLRGIEERLQASENSRSVFNANYERSHAILESKADSAHKRIDEHVADDLPKWKAVDRLGEEVRQLRDMVLAQQHTNRLLGWFTGILGSTIIVWLISNLLGLIK